MRPTSSFSIIGHEATAVFIVDNDQGRSVTNDAENVVKHLGVDYPNRRIFYKDTDGFWGELVHLNNIFLRFAGIAPVTFDKYKHKFQ